MSCKCNAALTHLVDYLEGELDEDEQQELESHFSDCPPCMRFLKSYRDTGEVCKKALQRSMPPEMKDALLSFLRASTGEG